MTLYQELRLDQGQLSGMGYADCAWADCWPLAGPIALWQSAMSVAISAQLQSNRIVFFDDKRLDRLRLGRLLAFGTADFLREIGRTSTLLGPAAAQSVPALS